MNNSKSDFTQGSILGKLIPFMMPILGALILQAAYGAVDLLVVGRFGTTEGLSAVSTGSQVLNLVTFVITQFAMGVTVLIARYIGEKRPEQIGALIGGAIVVFTMISVVLFVVMIIFSRQIAVIMQAPKEAVGLTSVYVKICGSGIFFIVAYNLLSAIFRGLGDSKSPLIFVAVACVINIVGDLVLVAGFNMNAAGAAIATVAAQAVSVVFALVLLFKRKLPFKITKKDFSINRHCRRALKVGLPLALQEFLTQIYLSGQCGGVRTHQDPGDPAYSQPRGQRCLSDLQGKQQRVFSFENREFPYRADDGGRGSSCRKDRKPARESICETGRRKREFCFRRLHHCADHRKKCGKAR